MWSFSIFTGTSKNFEILLLTLKINEQIVWFLLVCLSDARTRYILHVYWTRVLQAITQHPLYIKRNPIIIRKQRIYAKVTIFFRVGQWFFFKNWNWSFGWHLDITLSQTSGNEENAINWKYFVCVCVYKKLSNEILEWVHS